jgi:flagellar biosynthesis GTPase FlhF
LPREGLSRLWQKPRIEVLACLPDPGESVTAGPLADMREPKPRLDVLDTGAEPGRFVDVLESLAGETGEAERSRPDLSGTAGRSGQKARRISDFLVRSGLLPIHAQRIVEDYLTRHGDEPGSSLGSELALVRDVLASYWRALSPGVGLGQGAHLLVGPPGVGKTVCICKWLAQRVLVEDRNAIIWRVDGRTANTAEVLSVYAEILGVQVERFIPATSHLSAEDLLLIDVPGVDWNDRAAIDQLCQQFRQLPKPRVHLVLNAAYELPLLVAQARAFDCLPVADLIFTHLDEEPRWGKLWNFVLGTNSSISFLSAGQNVPGEWGLATPEKILSRQFPPK